ncbi:putative Tetratricopeptide TPR_1 repeat-containing protein [Candidatus Sulfobium mesophilum]|uniref:Putative Tetratricopeptide TPR_1 repeat-containing protein n=1 Tax=Candidatus Sulfobium mesophilum TaxID=2016548 RepID=A0A2U3QGK8_9BACT|nr:putative Tetratricopeptide TPR_1 repeat-containing protein [Candidatus Sulfobium mesophilum]
MNSSATPRSFTFLSLFLIAIVCLLCYSNTFHVPFQYDDPYNINEKPYVKDISAFFGVQPVEADSSFIMRTVTYFTFAVNYRLHRDDVVGYHVVNLVIHLFNGFLVYFLVLLTFKTPYFMNAGIWDQKSAIDKGESPAFNSQPQIVVFISLFAALLFVSHPVQTQAVTYIVQRLSSLATLFYLLSLNTYIKWRLIKQESGEPGAGTRNPKSEALKPKSGKWSAVWYMSSVIFAVFAMKSKEIAFTLPLVIALYEFLFFDGTLRKRILYLVPLLLTMLIIPLSLLGMTKPAGEIIGDVSKATKIGSALTRWEYLFTEFRVIVTYIRLLIFPVNQNLDYDYPVYHSLFDLNVLLSFLFLISLFGFGVYLLHRSRIDSPRDYRGIATTTQSAILNYKQSSRLIAFCIFWFFMTLSVESSVIPITDVIFEHRLYLPSAGFVIGAAAVITTTWPRLRESWRLPAKIGVAVCGLIIIVLSGLTYLRNKVWSSEVSLWQDVVSKSPAKARPYNGLGLAYQNEGKLDEALGGFARAVEIDPSYAVAHNNFGSTYFKKNLFGRAVEEFSRAIALEPDNAIFRNNRGLAYAAAGETDRAISDYLEAITLDSSYDDPYHNLGVVYHRKGLFEKAVEEYTKAINLETDNAVYYSNRGLSYSALLDFEKALADFTKAAALMPFFIDAYTGRGVAYGELGRLDEAHNDLNHAILLDPSRASSYINRAVTHERMRDITSALTDFQKACDLGDERGCGGVEYMRKKYHEGK